MKNQAKEFLIKRLGEKGLQAVSESINEPLEDILSAFIAKQKQPDCLSKETFEEAQIEEGLKEQLRKERDFNHMAENHLGNAVNAWSDKCKQFEAEIEKLKAEIRTLLKWKFKVDELEAELKEAKQQNEFLKNRNTEVNEMLSDYHLVRNELEELKSKQLNK